MTIIEAILFLIIRSDNIMLCFGCQVETKKLRLPQKIAVPDGVLYIEQTKASSNQPCLLGEVLNDETE